jgi:hypothetical protein
MSNKTLDIKEQSKKTWFSDLCKKNEGMDDVWLLYRRVLAKNRNVSDRFYPGLRHVKTGVW